MLSASGFNLDKARVFSSSKGRNQKWFMKKLRRGLLLGIRQIVIFFFFHIHQPHFQLIAMSDTKQRDEKASPASVTSYQTTKF